MQATITLLPGDGIGPEVVAEGAKVLAAVAEQWEHQFTLREALIGGCAIDQAGSSLPDETVQLCQASDAVLLGAVGGPRWDNPNAADRPERGLLGIRKALDLFANLRPVTVHPAISAASPLRVELLAGVDLIVVRELTGGIYFGAKTREPIGEGAERATDVCTYTTGEIERIVRVACSMARERRGKLTSVDKANVLETSRLWRSVTTRIVGEEYPDIQLEHMLVDAAAMHLLRRPADFDVIVTENMFGDILSDEASMLAGSMGLLPSASLGGVEPRTKNQEPREEQRTKNQEQTDTTIPPRLPQPSQRLGEVRGRGPGGEGQPQTRIGLYEPIHGSAPDIAGRGVANPLATILSVAMLLRHSLGLHNEAQAVEAAVQQVLVHGQVTPDIAPAGVQPLSTGQVGDAVVAALVRGS
ncbi:MAG TPA: 3-isopropylmalate dehydrogenase [Herpetosiphonaceae bacterium]